jgi:hypothetical protein
MTGKEREEWIWITSSMLAKPQGEASRMATTAWEANCAILDITLHCCCLPGPYLFPELRELTPSPFPCCKSYFPNINLLVYAIEWELSDNL